MLLVRIVRKKLKGKKALLNLILQRGTSSKSERIKHFFVKFLRVFDFLRGAKCLKFRILGLSFKFLDFTYIYLGGIGK